MTDELPPGWAFARLESLVGRSGVMTDGDWVESKDQDPDGEVRLIQLADVGDGSFLDKSNRFMTRAKAEDLNCTFLQPRDVLISRLGEPLGKTCLFPGNEQPSVTVVDVHVVRPASTVISREWLVHLMNSPPIRRLVDAQSSGTTRKRITGQKLKDLEVRVAPAAEQRRIASKVDELFSRIDEGERALERVSLLVDRYRQSVLKAAVTGELTRAWREKYKDTLESGEALLARILTARREAWEKAELEKMKAKGITPADEKWKQKYEEPTPPDCTGLSELPRGWTWASLGQLVWLSQNGLSKRTGDSGREVNVLRLADISNGQIASNAPRSIRLTEEETDKYRLEVGDLLCVRVNGSRSLTGRLIPIASDDEWAYCDHFIRFRPVPGLVQTMFLDLCFDAGQSRSVVEGRMVTTAGQNTVSQGPLFTVPIPLPPLAEQTALLSEVQRRLTQADRSLQDLSLVHRGAAVLRKTVLRSAFTGALVAQNAGDEPACALLERIAAERSADTSAPKRGRKKKVTA